MQQLLIFTAGFISLISMSCSTIENIEKTDLDYSSLVQKHSAREEHYQGLINVFQIHGTHLNEEIVNSQIQKKAIGYKWPDSKTDEEKKKADESLRAETSFFLSFFSPEPKLNDLDKMTSVWKLFMEVNGRRFEGKVVKISGLIDELILFYPYHNRFATAYRVTFPIPSYETAGASLKLTLTGPIGSENLEFPASR